MKTHLLSTDKEIDPSEEFVVANCGKIMKFTRALEFHNGKICERCRELDKGKDSIFTFMIIEICTLHIPDGKSYRIIEYNGKSFEVFACKSCGKEIFLPKVEQNAIHF